MPRATVNTTPEHFDLKTCPGGFVDLKRMPYGEWLTRTEMAMKITLEMGGKRGRGSTKGEMEMANRAVTAFEFKNCIVDHNLEDEMGNPLDFSGIQSLAILDPKIGNEIGRYVSDMHEFDEGNSEAVSSTSLQVVE